MQIRTAWCARKIWKLGFNGNLEAAPQYHLWLSISRLMIMNINVITPNSQCRRCRKKSGMSGELKYWSMLSSIIHDSLPDHCTFMLTNNSIPTVQTYLHFIQITRMFYIPPKQLCNRPNEKHSMRSINHSFLHLCRNFWWTTDV